MSEQLWTPKIDKVWVPNEVQDQPVEAEALPHALTPPWLEVRKVENRGTGGRGVFTLVEIEKDSMVEICPVITMPRNEVFGEDNTILSAYVFNFGQYGPDSEKVAIALGYGSLYNHSNKPNAVFEYDLDNDRILFVSLRNIQPNEEVMVDYGMEEMSFIPND